MVRQNGLSVRILDGVNGLPMPEYNNEHRGNKVVLEAVHGVTLCPEITIHREFEWHGANGLYITVDYGFPLIRLITLWAPDPYGGEETQDRKDWTIKIPGTRSWDPSTDRVTNVEFYCSSEHVRNHIHGNLVEL